MKQEYIMMRVKLRENNEKYEKRAIGSSFLIKICNILILGLTFISSGV